MPTFNQLVRKGRQTTTKKSTAPALQKSYTLYGKKLPICLLHRREVYVLLLRLLHLRSLTQLLEKIARVRLSNGIEVTSYIPGEGHNYRSTALF